MKVNVFTLARRETSDGRPPRAWRISTADGVFWLFHDGATARLLRLPLPLDDAGDGTAWSDDPLSRGTALALAAEMAAAGRWIRQGADDAPPDAPTANAPG